VAPNNDIFPVLLFEFIASLLGLGLITFIWYKKLLKPSYLIYIVPAFFLPTLTGSFASMPRYLLSLFPLFYVLATFKLGKFKPVLVAVFILTLVWALIRFTRGLWVA